MTNSAMLEYQHSNLITSFHQGDISTIPWHCKSSASAEILVGKCRYRWVIFNILDKIRENNFPLSVKGRLLVIKTRALACWHLKTQCCLYTRWSFIMVSNINLTLYHYSPVDKEELFSAGIAMKQNFGSVCLPFLRTLNIFFTLPLQTSQFLFNCLAYPIAYMSFSFDRMYEYSSALGNWENTVQLAFFSWQ